MDILPLSEVQDLEAYDGVVVERAASTTPGLWLDSRHNTDPEEILDAMVNHVLAASGPQPAR